MLVACPDCAQKLKLTDDLAPGKRIKCPKCSTVFRPSDMAVRVEKSAARPKPSSDQIEVVEVVGDRPASPAGKSRTRRPRDDEDQDDEDFERRPRKRKKKKKSSHFGLILGLSIGGGVLLVAGLVVAILILARGASGTAFEQQEAAVKELIQTVRELDEVLRTVRDPGSGKAAAPKILQLCSKMESLKSRADSLPKVTKAEEDQLSNKYLPELNRLVGSMQGSIIQATLRARTDPDFVAAMKRLESAARNMKSRSR
jgi:hypothetical protein